MRGYPYECPCGHKQDVYKNVSEINRIEVCLKCGQDLDKTCRKIAKRQSFFGEKVEDAAYNPAFGKVIQNKEHARREAKARGMIEVGNEDFNKYQDKKEQDRQDVIDRKWEKL